MGGLRRVGGNPAVYLKILRKFRDTQADTVQRVEVTFDNGDLETARREAHTLKGVAGNIGADDLHASAGELEHAIRDGEDNIEQEIATARASLALVLDSLATLGETVQRKKTEDADLSQVEPLLGKLRELLEDDDTEAVTPLNQLRELLSGSDHEEALDAVGRCIDDFDFDEALQQLAVLEKNRPSELSAV
jgi:HPt (histidine-containing phosphotransfer) domain-containing protein